MLPDFPKVRARAEVHLQKVLERAVAHRTGFMQKMRPYFMPEGRRYELKRSDGSTQDDALQPMRSPFTLRRDDLEKHGLQAVIAAIARTADDMAEKQSRFFFKRMNEIIEEAGQSYDAQGQPLTVSLLLKSLERVHIDFDANGRPEWPTLLVGKALYERMKNLKESDEERDQLCEFVNRKRIEWRDRESDRKLVG